MDQQEFYLKNEMEFIPLNKLLQVLSLAQTGGHAKIMILNKEVKVNGKVEIQIRKKLYEKDTVKLGKVSITIKATAENKAEKKGLS